MKNLFPIAFAFLLFSCHSTEVADSNTVSQDQIYMKYQAEYDDETTMLKIWTNFRFGGKGGTTLKLVDGSYVKYNGSELAGRDVTFTGYCYQMEKTSSYPGVHQFEFQDTEGKAYTNSVKMGHINIVGPQHINREEGTSISWEGEVEPYISTRLHVRCDSISKSFPIKRSMEKIDLDPTFWAAMPNGNAEFRISKRFYSEDIESAQLGGYLKASYDSKFLTIPTSDGLAE